MTTLETISPIRSLAEEAPKIVFGDAFEWLENRQSNSIHAVVTDPPYGLVEYSPRQLNKLREGRGGVWRIPPAFDSSVRKPLPRFTVLNDGDKERLEGVLQASGKFADAGVGSWGACVRSDESTCFPFRLPAVHQGWV